MPLSLLKTGFAFALLAFLAACGSSAPKHPIKEPTGQIDPTREAVILMSAFAKDGADLDLVKIYLQNESSTANHYYIFSEKAADKEFFVRLPPGRYKFIIVSRDILAQPREPLPVKPYDPATGIPLSPLDVKAGDVIHAGRILVSGLGGSAVTGRNDKVKYEIIDRTPAAKSALEQHAPDLVSKLETKLIQVVE